MASLRPRVIRLSRSARIGLVALALALLAGPAVAQTDYGRNSAVGGIMIDAQGLLSNATVDQTGRLEQLLSDNVKPAPAELGRPNPLRKVSLRKLEAAIDQLVKDGKPLPEEIRYLAGLQEIRYVFVYPEQKDIVLAGPGEGWRVSPKGAVVGATSGRPVMLLDDLVVALRTAGDARHQAISCSIDPTPEGKVRLDSFFKNQRSVGDAGQMIAAIEQTMGPQKITLTGVPDTSRFARVLVAADYRMKRIAMQHEPSPVAGLPSFLALLNPRGPASSVTPRWWLEPRLESVSRSPDGLAWELAGASVKAMTEEDFFNASGQREKTVKASPVAQRWADLMTEKYGELAVADPVFGELRNCMQLAIVSALIVQENLTEKAGHSLPTLLSPTDVQVAAFPAPKQVATQANVIPRGRGWIITASGGVQINSYAPLREVRQNDKLASIRTDAAAPGDGWWWN